MDAMDQEGLGAMQYRLPAGVASQAPQSRLRAVDFFCGAGGMTHGLLSAGLDVLGGIDNHLPCKATYEHPENNVRPDGQPAAFIHADISEYDPQCLAKQLGIEKEDDALVFIGCSPCKYWTKLNTSREKSAASKALLEHFCRFVDAFRPGYVVVENVPGLRTKAANSRLGALLSLLESAGYGYSHDTVRAYLYGVPQKRSRYLLMATRVCSKSEEPAITLPQPAKTNGNRFPEDMKLKHHIGEQRGFPRLEAGERCEEPPLHWAAGLSAQNLQRIKLTPKDGGSRDAWKDDANLQIKAYQGRDDIFRDIYGRMRWDEPASTITTRFNSLSNGRFGHPDEDRAISLREGAVLQTFPLTYIFPKSLPGAASQIGNAVPPELARRIGCQIVEHYHCVKIEEACG